MKMEIYIKMENQNNHIILKEGFRTISIVFGITIILSIFIDLKTTRNSYINEKQSKAKHFNLNNLSSKDIVFIEVQKLFIIYLPTHLKKMVLIFIILVYQEFFLQIILHL